MISSFAIIELFSVFIFKTDNDAIEYANPVNPLA